MGCLNVMTQRVGGLNVATQRVGGLDVELTRIGKLDVSAKRVGSLKVKVLFVCTVGRTSKYLRVTPENPLWITVGQDLTYTIRSNADWVVL